MFQLEDIRIDKVRMAVVNIAFITFLALKNTPLAFLTSYSYERLNQLHQLAGYTTCTFIFIHLTLMIKMFTSMNKVSVIMEEAQIYGMVAATATLTTLISAIIIRRLRYELFYVIHIFMYMLIVINISLHRPDFADKTIFVSQDYTLKNRSSYS